MTEKLKKKKDVIMPKISIVTYLGEWSVEFTIGKQSFNLISCAMKKDAVWYKRQLKIAFRKMIEGKIK